MIAPIHLQQLFYYFCYSPLICALLCLLLTYKKLAFLTTFFCFASIALVLAFFLPNFFSFHHSIVLQDTNYLGSLNAINTAVLLIITLIYCIILLFYRKNLIKTVPEKRHCYFYALLLVNFFNLIGIITTNDLLKLYLFIEIYSLGCLILISFDNNKQMKQLNFHNYCFNVASSILLLFTFLLMYMIFNDSNIVNYWFNLQFSHNIWLADLFFLFFIFVIIIKFLPFWQYFYKLKTKSWLSKIFLIEGVFIKSLLAIFLSHKIINSVFGLNFENYWFSQGLIIFSSCFVCYCTFLSIKTQHLKLISLLLSLSTIGFLLIILGLNQYNISHNSFVFWLLQLFFTNFFIFLLSDLLQIKNSNTKIWQLNKLKNHTFLKMIFCILITQLTFLPITFGFLASWFLLTENINSPLFWLIVFSLAVYNLAQVIFANKLLHKIIFT